MTDEEFDFDLPRAQLRLLLEAFSRIEDDREPCKVMYPLDEVLFLVVCGTICSCDDFDDIVLWGEQNLAFLRRFSEFYFGVPGAAWLRALLNRIDPALFADCFEAWIAALWPERHERIAIDGKTARRTHDRKRGLKSLHTLSAYASSARLVLAQRCVPEKANEITAIPDLLDQLARNGQLEGAVVTLDAMGCQIAIAQKIIDHGAHYVLSLKGNQPTLEADVLDYFRTAPAHEILATTTLEKGHGRIETRHYKAAAHSGWIASDRSYPGAPRFPGITTLVQVHRTTEQAGDIKNEVSLYLSSLPPDIQRIAAAIRGHWSVESLHWSLDVTFNEDQSRYRRGNGAKNMALVRRFAFNLLRQTTRKTGKRPTSKAVASLKSKRKIASWSPQFLLQVLQLQPR